jgi:putative ABC transport system permease protein
VLCRLKPKTTLESAKADLERVAKQFGHTLPDRSSYDGSVEGIRVRPLSWFRQSMSFRGPAVLIILQVSVALMLLLACANVSGLLLARVTLRQKEMGIRAELGASRSRLIRQLLTESLLLALMGGIVGLLLAWGMTHLLIEALPSTAELPFSAASINSAGMNGRMLGFTLVVTLLTGLVFGLTPAFVGSKAKPADSSLQGRWQWKVTFPKQHIHSLLVVIEVAVALVLLTRAALEVQDALRKPEYRPGLAPDNVVTLNVHLPEAIYATKPEVLDAYTRIVQAVQRVPQIKSVGVAGQVSLFEGSFPFLHGNNGVGIIPEVANGTSAPFARATSFTAVSPTLLSTLRIPLRMGRYFSDQASEDSVPPAVIMEHLAKRLFRNQNPLGKRIKIVELPDDFKVPQQFNLAMEQQMKQIATMTGKSYVIVGITENLWGERFRADVYVPYLQTPENALHSMRFMTLVARTTTDGAELTDAVSKAVWQVDKNLPISQAKTLTQVFEERAAPDRLLRQLLAFFAAASLFLAAIGIYALVTYVVGQRTREIAVRLSIGARPAEVMRSVVIQGVKLIVLGVAFGMLLTLTLPLFFVLVFGIVTLNPQYITGDLAPERLMFLLVGLLGGTVLILVISGLNSLKRDSSQSGSAGTSPWQVMAEFKRLLGKASRLTLTGVMGGLYLSSALLGLYIFFTDSARMVHPQAFASGSLVLACVTLTACCLTARKAMRVDPVDALRCD